MMKKPRWSVIGATSAVCLIASVLIYIGFFISYDSTLGSWWNLASWREKLQFTNGDIRMALEGDSLKYLLRRLVRGKDLANLETTGFSCHTDIRYEICISTEPVRVTSGGLTVHVSSNRTLSTKVVQPYTLINDKTAMKEVTSVKILQGEPEPPACSFTHKVPALVFSSGGFTGNAFHEFNDVVIPLFLTCRHLSSRVQFIITDFKSSWVDKYARFLSWLSNFKVLDLSKDVNGVHCFPGAVVGLRYYDNLALNASEPPGGLSTLQFRQFLRESYSLKVTYIRGIRAERPTVFFLSRNATRRILNEDSVVRLMEEEGFRVIVAGLDAMLNLDEVARMIGSCSLMVGVHGAGLTHELFLPDGAVVIQIVPLGMEWAASNYFGGPAASMGLAYIEYKIEVNESSLSRKYRPDDPVIIDSGSLYAKGYYTWRAVYVDGQDINIDLVRFKKTLTEAKMLLRQGVS